MSSKIKNYKTIISNLVKYLPAKIFVVLCSCLIIPIFTNILNVKEVSIYLISIQLLNIFCTLSSDWIAKAILRFYVKYKIKDKISEFFSTIIWISTIVYGIVIVCYFFVKDIIYENLLVNNVLLFIIILLIIPCGIRQTLYQLVRIKNKPKIYTLSIILYQSIFITTFLILAQIIQNYFSIIISMVFALIFIDIYLLKSVKIEKFSFKLPDKEILLNALKYSCPLIFTNISYCFFLKFPLFIFQKTEYYLYSASFSLASTIANMIITIFAGLFLFVAFPIFVKDFEFSKNIKEKFTNFVQLYFYLLSPILASCILFSEEIVVLILPSEYIIVGKLLPAVAIIFFFHEFLKIINIKYHLKNKTYLEMWINVSISALAIFMMPSIIEKFSLDGVIILMILTELLLFIANYFLKVKDIDYIDYSKIFKTNLYLFIIIGIIYIIISKIYLPIKLLGVCKIVIFLFFTYFINYHFKDKILS